jgi:glycosyltransferase involved in cell wall biosynthesis
VTNAERVCRDPVRRRIVVVAEYFPPRLGADRRIFELMKRLSTKYDIHFLTLPPSYTLFIRKIDAFDRKQPEVTSDGMRGHRIDLPKLISNLWTRSFVIAFVVTEIYLCLRMLKKLAQLNPDLVIIDHTSAYTGLIGLICSEVMGKKLLVDYNDLMGVYTFDLVGKRMGGLLGAVLRRILVLVEDTLVRYGWKVTTITAFIRDYARTRNVREDITIIPNGVDTSLFDPNKVDGKKIRLKYGIGSGEKLCFYAGRIDEVAGAQIILETAKLLESEGKIRFMIVGEGKEEMVGQFSKCDNVILTGRIAKENVPEYLAAADCVFVPFPNNVASHGISPLKLFEALAMEKPVIASAISGIREAVCHDPNVALVSNDPKCWASAVTKLIKNGEVSIQQRKNSRRLVCQMYDFDQLAAVFDKVVESGF